MEIYLKSAKTKQDLQLRGVGPGSLFNPPHQGVYRGGTRANHLLSLP